MTLSGKKGVGKICKCKRSEILSCFLEPKTSKLAFVIHLFSQNKIGLCFGSILFDQYNKLKTCTTFITF